MIDYAKYRAEKIDQGAEFQDFVSHHLYLAGMSIGAYASKKYQIEKGENLCGVEIKYDSYWDRGTGRLWIEVGERAVQRNGPYVLSGIFRDDNQWLFVIGGYKKFFVFATTTLRNIMPGDDHLNENQYKTGLGFYLGSADAEKWAARIFSFDEKREPIISDSKRKAFCIEWPPKKQAADQTCQGSLFT